MPLLACMLAMPAVTHAQACVGRPIGGLAGRAIVADVAHVRYEEAVGAADVEGGASGMDVGAAYWANPGGFIAYSIGYARRLMPGTDSDVARLGLVAELPPTRILPPGGGICLTSGISGSWYAPPDPADERRVISVPLGVAAGFVVPAGPTARFYPYVIPRLVLTDYRGGPTQPSDPTIRPAVEAGLGFARGPLVGRARVGTALRGVGSARPPLPDLRIGVELGMRF
jgi:hypothetical protein